MNDFISTPPAPASPPGSTIAAGAWWPEVDVNVFRDAYALGGTTIPHARVVEAVEYALQTVTGQLAEWKAAHLADGKASLLAIEAEDQVGEKTRLESLFLRAVHMTAAAELADNHPDLTATEPGTDRGEQRRSMAGDYRARATHAIRDMLGVTRCSVELI